MERSTIERSTIERIINSLNNGGNGQDVLSTTEVVTLQPPPRFSGRSLVEELIDGFATDETRNAKLVYDQQSGRWTFPD